MTDTCIMNNFTYLVQLLHDLSIHARGPEGPKLLKVIKNPITDHLPTGCWKIGTYISSDVCIILLVFSLVFLFVVLTTICLIYQFNRSSVPLICIGDKIYNIFFYLFAHLATCSYFFLSLFETTFLRHFSRFLFPVGTSFQATKCSRLNTYLPTIPSDGPVAVGEYLEFTISANF